MLGFAGQAGACDEAGGEGRTPQALPDAGAYPPPNVPPTSGPSFPLGSIESLLSPNVFTFNVTPPDPHLHAPHGVLTLLRDLLTSTGWEISLLQSQGGHICHLVKLGTYSHAEFASSPDLAFVCAALKALGVVSRFTQEAGEPESPPIPAASESGP